MTIIYIEAASNVVAIFTDSVGEQDDRLRRCAIYYRHYTLSESALQKLTNYIIVSVVAAVYMMSSDVANARLTTTCRKFAKLATMCSLERLEIKAVAHTDVRTRQYTSTVNVNTRQHHCGRSPDHFFRRKPTRKYLAS